MFYSLLWKVFHLLKENYQYKYYISLSISFFATSILLVVASQVINVIFPFLWYWFNFSFISRGENKFNRSLPVLTKYCLYFQNWRELKTKTKPMEMKQNGRNWIKNSRLFIETMIKIQGKKMLSFHFQVPFLTS